jgi:uncharacterized protein YndB with AHSA1/START domain
MSSSRKRVSIVLAGVLGIVGSGLVPAQRALEPQVSEGIVRASPAEVWEVFSTAEGFKKLGVAHCEMDFRIGGLIRTHYDPKGKIGDEGTIENEILAFEPGRMVTIRIHKAPKGFPFSEETRKGTWTVISLGDLGDARTQVRITALGYPDSEDGRKMQEFFKSGNAFVIATLAKRFDSAAKAPAGPAHPVSTLAPISQDRLVELPRAEVWDLLTTSAGWKKFIGVETRIELKLGGKWEILFGAGSAPEGKQGSEGCTVLSFLPERMLSFTWNAPPKLAHARERRTWVVVDLEEVAPARTRVRLEHLGFVEQAADNPDHRAEWEEARGYFAQAWPKVLDALKAQGKGQ